MGCLRMRNRQSPLPLLALVYMHLKTVGDQTSVKSILRPVTSIHMIRENLTYTPRCYYSADLSMVTTSTGRDHPRFLHIMHLLMSYVVPYVLLCEILGIHPCS